MRDAQAYMLISMPTDTSTIFGAFQLIRFSRSSNPALSRPELNLEIYRMLRGENGQAWAEFNRPLEKLMEYIPPNIEILKLLTA